MQHSIQRNARRNPPRFSSDDVTSFFFIRPALLTIATVVIMLFACSPHTEEQAQTASQNTSPSARWEDSGTFTSKACYQQYFPLVFGVPSVAVPPEVRFYCAAPWNIASFEQVSVALKESGFDAVGATVRAAPEEKRPLLEKVLPLAIRAANEGPRGMGAVWHTYHFLPILDAINRNSSSVDFQKEDVEKLRQAAKKIDWAQPVLVIGVTQENSAISKDARLHEVAQFILSLYSTKK